MARTVEDFKLGSGCLGNGTTFWNSKKEIAGDYEKIAHISNDGLHISFYVNDLPESLKKVIRDYAKSQVKPPEIIDSKDLPFGFDEIKAIYQGYSYVKCDPAFHAGKEVWLRREKVCEHEGLISQIKESYPMRKKLKNS